MHHGAKALSFHPGIPGPEFPHKWLDIRACVQVLYIWQILRDVLAAAPRDFQAANIPHYGWMAVLFAILSYLIYVAALLCSHLSAFRVATNLRLQVAEHLSKLPLGFTESFGSGKLRKIIQESTGAAETYLAHQLRTVAGAGKIVVLSDGVVAEQGKPQALYAENGLYIHMVDLQNGSQNWTI